MLCVAAQPQTIMSKTESNTDSRCAAKTIVSQMSRAEMSRAQLSMSRNEQSTDEPQQQRSTETCAHSHSCPLNLAMILRLALRMPSVRTCPISSP